MKTLKQLLREFWLPFALASAWTTYVLVTGPTPLSFKTVVTAFGPAFFLVSWATGQFIRVKRQSHVESNFLSIQTRLEALLTQIETRTTDLLGHITGGSSFCYVLFFNIDETRNTASLFAINGSTHPVFDAQLRIADLECLERASAANGAIPFASCSTHFRIPTLIAGHGGEIGQIPLGEGKVRRFNIFWLARNGDWTQLLRLAKVNGVWRSATRILRGETVLYEDLPPDFPRDALGSEWKQNLPNGTA